MLSHGLQGFTHQQMTQVERNSVVLEEREKEIIAIVQSISEINELYRDLATLVVEQVSHWHSFTTLGAN